MTALAEQIKQLIIDALDLEDMTPEDINTDAPLFGEGLGLDSIDALELGLAIQKKYGIKLEKASEQTRQYFYSVATLVQFVQSQSDDTGE